MGEQRNHPLAGAGLVLALILALPLALWWVYEYHQLGKQEKEEERP